MKKFSQNDTCRSTFTASDTRMHYARYYRKCVEIIAMHFKLYTCLCIPHVSSWAFDLCCLHTLWCDVYQNYCIMHVLINKTPASTPFMRHMCRFLQLVSFNSFSPSNGTFYVFHAFSFFLIFLSCFFSHVYIHTYIFIRSYNF